MVNTRLRNGIILNFLLPNVVLPLPPKINRLMRVYRHGHAHVRSERKRRQGSAIVSIPPGRVRPFHKPGQSPPRSHLVDVGGRVTLLPLVSDEHRGMHSAEPALVADEHLAPVRARPFVELIPQDHEGLAAFVIPVGGLVIAPPRKFPER